jgi:hypothetical protein
MSGLVEDSANKYGIQLTFINFMFSERTVAFHEVVNIDDFPHSEPILAHPFHQSFEFVLAFKVFWGQHLILENNQMLPGVYLVRDGDLLDIKAQRDADSEQDAQYHFFITLIDLFVLFRVDELLVVFSYVFWRVSDQAHIVCFVSLDVLLRSSVCLSVD